MHTSEQVHPARLHRETKEKQQKTKTKKSNMSNNKCEQLIHINFHYVADAE